MAQEKCLDPTSARRLKIGCIGAGALWALRNLEALKRALMVRSLGRCGLRGVLRVGLGRILRCGLRRIVRGILRRGCCDGHLPPLRAWHELRLVSGIRARGHGCAAVRTSR